MVDVIVKNGCIPIFHRFCNIDEQIAFCKRFQNNCFVSCELNDYDKFELLYKHGALCVCLCSGTTQMLIDEITGGLRSALTYSGSLNIKEFQKKVVFVEVTNTYMS